MSDNAEAKADRIESKALLELERLYPAAVSPLIEKHKQTFEQLKKLEKAGAVGRARVMLRRSGLINDLARAIASAGRDAAKLIRAEVRDVKKAVEDEEERTQSTL